MSYDLILLNINKHILLDKEEVSFFVSLLKEKCISKRDRLLDADEVCKQISFVLSGTLRAFHVDKSGKESTIMFAVADWWVTDMFSFVNQQPAMLNIEAIEHSTVLQLLKEDLDKLYIKVSKFERFFRIIIQNAYVREQLRVIQNLSLSAEERYENFLKKYPNVVQQVTQKQIASYLGITPEFLSMIRASRTRK